MKPSLLHPLREPRHARRHRRGTPRAGEAASTVEPDPRAAPVPEPVAHQCDPDARRVRQAGGPIDRASYSCSCGYVFHASVSTSVSCPHCGAEQAW
ncbi:MAG TPA: hypothetical protein VK790_09645 [Solirubrobacteraceae bacterium]|nr:hypothetical protein [Solirubrobacteraceae bacterium]